MSLKHIYTIARYEITLQFRSKSVRILGVVFSLTTVFFVVYSYLNNTIEPAVPGALAIKCFFWFSLFRMVLSPFFVPEFVKEDGFDTFQAIAPRPYTNTSYIIGKLSGLLCTMLMMDYFFMVVLAVYSVVFTPIAFSPVPYVLYPVLITLPLTVFLFGFHIFAAQLCYPLIYVIPIALLMIFFPLEDIEHTRVFDLGAITLPLTYSAITGFYNLQRILFQRCIYFSAGLAFTGLSILLMRKRRAPSKNRILYISTMIAAFFAVSVFSIMVEKFYIVDMFRPRHVVIHSSGNYPHLSVETCDLVVNHLDSSIDIQARMKVTNPHDKPLSTLFLRHHMTFHTYDVSSESNNVKSFGNSYDSIVIELYTPLQPDESIMLEISDYGSIFQTFSFYHIPDFVMESVHRSGLAPIGKQLAFLERDYVLLPAEMNWYPTSYPQFTCSEPGFVQRDLTQFTLEVHTHNGLRAISQGAMTQKDDDVYCFEPQKPITKLSLVIGPYHKKSVRIDSVEYSYYWIANDIFRGADIRDNDLTRAIRLLKKNIENKIHIPYPFERYQIVETPIHFFGYSSYMDLSSPYDQPEIRFIPESTISFNSYIQSRSRRLPKGIAVLSQSVFPDIYTTTTLNEATRNKMNPPPTILNLGGFWHIATDPFVDYSHILSQYIVFPRGRLSDNDYFNLVAVTWLRSKFPFHDAHDINSPDFNYRMLDSASSQYLYTKSLKDILHEQRNYHECMDILCMASKTFFTMLAAKSDIPINTIEDIVMQVFASRDHDVIGQLSQLCGMDIISFFNDFIEQKGRAHYFITDKSMARHEEQNKYYYNVRFSVTNPTPYPGLIVGSIDDNSGEQDRKAVYLEPFSKKEVGLVSEQELMAFKIEWLPFGPHDFEMFFTENTYGIPASVSIMAPDEIAFFDGIRAIDQEAINPSVIVDNLHDKCSILSRKTPSFFQRMQTQHPTGYLKFTPFKGSKDIPDYWSLVYSMGSIQEFHGAYSSCYFKKAGNGDSAVEYRVPLDEPGRYDVYISAPKRDKEFHLAPMLESHILGDTNVRIMADDNIYEENVDIGRAESEWAYVGTYSFGTNEAIVQITDKTSAKAVLADAVNLRKVHGSNK